MSVRTKYQSRVLQRQPVTSPGLAARAERVTLGRPRGKQARCVACGWELPVLNVRDGSGRVRTTPAEALALHLEGPLGEECRHVYLERAEQRRGEPVFYVRGTFHATLSGLSLAEVKSRGFQRPSECQYAVAGIGRDGVRRLYQLHATWPAAQEAAAAERARGE